MPPKFIYFDLGNVLLYFDHQLACQQMSAVSGVAAERIWDVLFDRGLKWRYEAGELTREEYYSEFCKQAEITADVEALDEAGSSIFRLNHSILPVVVQLEAAGYPLGVLSNICESHWKYVCSDRFGILPQAFKVHALSFRIGAIKPDPQVYKAAADLAGVDPGEIFYTDDIPGHVKAATEAGFDAVQYTTTSSLVDDLRRRGLKFNY